MRMQILDQHRLGRHIRQSIDDIVFHSLRIYGKKATDDVGERALSHGVVHARTAQLLKCMDKLMEEDTIRDSYRKAHFLDCVSHELRTPLNAILGFSDILCDEHIYSQLPAEELEECRARGRQGTRDLRHMVSGTLEMWVIGTGQQPVERTTCHLSPLLHGVVRDYKTQVAKGITLRTDFGGNLTPIHTDPILLKRAINLLMDNACKFTREGSITLGARSHTSSTEIFVADTGCGIPADKAETVFGYFEKLDEFVPGIGLGLCLCRTTLRLLDAEVRLDTDYEGGCRFVIKMMA